MEFAAEVLRKRAHKITKKGKRLAKMSTEQRHKLRIAAKKLRYGSEFFASLFQSTKEQKHRAKFVRRLKALQDCLGELNDVAAHNELCTSIAEQAPRTSNSHIGFFAGIALGREEAKLERLKDSSQKALRSFKHAAPFW